MQTDYKFNNHCLDIYASQANDYYGSEDYDRASRMLNDLLDDMLMGKYKEGCRNNMAVDLVCLCHVLGLDAKLVAHEFLKNDKDYYDISQRIPVIETYTNTWDKSYDGVFSMMVYGPDPSYYEKFIRVIYED